MVSTSHRASVWVRTSAGLPNGSLTVRSSSGVLLGSAAITPAVASQPSGQTLAVSFASSWYSNVSVSVGFVGNGAAHRVLGDDAALVQQ